MRVYGRITTINFKCSLLVAHDEYPYSLYPASCIYFK